jgi:hypothetical protein
MGAHNIITTTKSRPVARHPVLALALVACSLVIPATAGAVPVGSDPVDDSGYSSVSSLTGGSSEPSQVSGAPATNSGYASLNAVAGPSPNESTIASDSGYSSVNAVTGPSPSEPTLVSSPPSGADDGFDWASAAIGAGAILGMLSLAGAVLLSTRRRPVSPSTAAMH